MRFILNQRQRSEFVLCYDLIYSFDTLIITGMLISRNISDYLFHMLFSDPLLLHPHMDIPTLPIHKDSRGCGFMTYIPAGVYHFKFCSLLWCKFMQQMSTEKPLLLELRSCFHCSLYDNSWSLYLTIVLYHFKPVCTSTFRTKHELHCIW